MTILRQKREHETFHETFVELYYDYWWSMVWEYVAGFPVYYKKNQLGKFVHQKKENAIYLLENAKAFNVVLR